MSKKILRFVLRLEPEMHEKLVEIAEAERRSLHSQILHFLSSAIEDEEGRQMYLAELEDQMKEERREAKTKSLRAKSGGSS